MMATKVSELRPKVLEVYNLLEIFVLTTPTYFEDHEGDDSMEQVLEPAVMQKAVMLQWRPSFYVFYKTSVIGCDVELYLTLFSV